MQMQTDQLDKLFKALSQAQAEFPTIASNRKAYTNSYADHYTIMRHVYPILKKYGLSVMPWAGLIEGVPMVGARLGHESGQYIINSYEFVVDELLPQKDKRTHKTAGALTYFKRYHVKDILGVLLSDDPADDDLQGEYIPEPTKNVAKKINSSDKISADQLDYLKNEIQDDQELETKIKNYYRVPSLQAIPKDQFNVIVEKIKEYKQALRDRIK